MGNGLLLAQWYFKPYRWNSFRNMANRERTNLVTENNQFLGAGIIATITSTVFNTVKSVIKMLFAW